MSCALQICSCVSPSPSLLLRFSEAVFQLALHVCFPPPLIHTSPSSHRLSSETAKSIPSRCPTSTLPDYDIADLPFHATAKTNSLGSPFVSITFVISVTKKTRQETLHGEACAASQSEGTVHNSMAGMKYVTC